MAVIARAVTLLNSESKRKRNMQQQNPRQLAGWGGSASSGGLVKAQGAGLQLVEEEPSQGSQPHASEEENASSQSDCLDS